MSGGNVNLKKDLEQLFSDFKWDFIGIADDKKKIIPTPKNSTCITAIIEQKALEILDTFVTENYNCELVRAPTTREYPDAILRGGIFGDKTIALDIKTTRKIGHDRITGLTIGSYAGYFLHPDEKRAGCSIPYGNFDEHWIVAFLYKWDSRKNSKEMVSEIDCVVNLKWKMASKSTGTGTTKHIGSVKSIQALKDGRGGFDSESEFLKFWRNKGRSLR